MLEVAGVDPGQVQSHTEFTDATFNTVYRIGLRGAAADLVLKVAPDPSLPTLTYERGIMRTEVMFYEQSAGHAPVPEVLHANFTRDVIGSDFLVLTELPGANVRTERERIGLDDWARLRRQLGGQVAALHRVTGTGFGYPQAALAPSWRIAFLAMVDAILMDADSFAAALPESTAVIREKMWAQADLLDAVSIPALVHFDLWDGNVLMDWTSGHAQVSGLVDGERAFWGDPIADFVSLALFADIEQDEPFLQAYRSAGGEIDFTSDTRRRLTLYRCYLYLIMLVEAVPRDFSGPDHERRARCISRELVAGLEILSAGI